LDSVAIHQGSPWTNDVLSVDTASHDADSDTVTYAYQWRENGTPIAGATGATLSPSAHTNEPKAPAISVTVTPYDATGDGTPRTSAAFPTRRSSELLDSVAIHQGSPWTNDVLSVDTASHDADSDTVSYAYQWRKNGTPIAGATGATLDLSAAGNGAKGDDISVTVTPNDGTVAGTAQTSAAVTV